VIRRFSAVFLCASTLILTGCSAGSDLDPSRPPVGPVADAAAPRPARGSDPGGPSSADTKPAASAVELTPVPIADGKATLSPANTSIGFVGTHTGSRPDPRIGGFAEFTGTAEVDAAGKTLKSTSVEIQTGSLWTQIPPLTNHLKSADFFDTGRHPTARFRSKSIAPEPDKGIDAFTISGELTLLGKTKGISFPAKIKVGESGLTLSGTFTLDRTDFGMDRAQEKVKKGVTINLAIGKKTEPQAGAGPGGPGFGRGRPPGGKGQPKG